jgi:two-component system, cell cycle response regulator DivK
MRGKTVLLVNADEDSQIIYTTILRFNGVNVVSVRTGYEALDAIREHSPDLLVIEQVLPRLDGWSLIEQLKAEAKGASIPVVFLMSHEPDSDYRERIEGRCAAWLMKPCSPARVVDAVRSCMEHVAYA